MAKEEKEDLEEEKREEDEQRKLERKTPDLYGRAL
jgi:hypothetical protein